MKKTVFLLIFILICLSKTVVASARFDEVLSDKIEEYGVFEDGSGIVYAGEKSFENRPSLLLVRTAASEIVCEVYDDSDGIQLTDSLEIPCGADSSYRLAAVTSGGADYLMLTSDSDNELFAVQNDTLTRVAAVNYDTVEYIVEYKQGQFVSYISQNSVYNFLNSLKERTIADYTFLNRINSISDADSENIKLILSACADIMRFDIKDYDYDTLFKYVLYTHKNFQILTDLVPYSSQSSSLGFNNVSVVSSEYIDYIMENVFRITPEKPPVNNLLSRGFCYSGGYYYYTGGFNVYFATEVLRLKAVYDLGGGVTFVVFSDIYYEGDTKTPEYSFAVMQKTDSSYYLLRLGMGESLPSQAEIREYSPLSARPDSVWNTPKKSAEGTLKDRLLLPLLLLIISVGMVGLACSIAVLVKMRKK